MVWRNLTHDVEEKVHPEDVDPDVVRIRSQGCGTKIGQRDIVHLQAMLQKNQFQS
jgi:hypothetical protein